MDVKIIQDHVLEEAMGRQGLTMEDYLASFLSTFF